MSKNAILLLIILSLFSCKEEDKTVTFSGKITNHLGNDGSVKSRDGYSKAIKIAEDGSFSEVFDIPENGLYSFTDGNEFTQLFLRKGDEINMTLDTKEFDETIKFTGNGAENSNYLAKKSLLSEKLLTESLFSQDEKTFAISVKSIISKFTSALADTPNLDSALIDTEKKGLIEMEKGITEQYNFYKKEKESNAKFIGKPSPNFENYENYKGGTTSLKDLKGKYVYVDVWATWCGPCKAEIPHLQKLEKELHDKNITFLSISVDEKDKHDAWKSMIKEKNMSGVQLFADKSWKSDFVTGYGINGIPRFILIDPNGNVVDPSMSRPSSPNTKARLLKLLK